MGSSGIVDLNCSLWIWSWALRVPQRAKLHSTGTLKFWQYRLCLLQILLIPVCMPRCESLQSLWKDFLLSVQQSTVNSSLLDHCSINISLSVWLGSAERPGRHSVFVCKTCLLLDWKVQTVGVNGAVLHSSTSLSLPLIVILFITDAVWSLPRFVAALPLLLSEIVSYGNACSEFPWFISQRTVRIKAMTGVGKKWRG